jgi:mycothiol synthase
MKEEIDVRNYGPDDLPALVGLINEADAVDRLERATTLQEKEHEMTFPDDHPETDCFLAREGNRLVGYAYLHVRRGNPDRGEVSTIYCRGVVHPRWRRHGLGRRLLETAYRRAEEVAAGIERGPVYFQCSGRDVEQDRQALYEGFGMALVRYFVNMVRPLNGDLPPVEIPAGFRLRTFDPERDAETVWRVHDLAFRDHFGYTDSSLDEFVHWMELPYLRPELWFLAEKEASGQVVGLGLNLIEPDWIAQTGRQEGYVDTLGVLPNNRHKGLGTALLVQSLHALQQAGMEAAHLDADAENPTGAMGLYERAGFRLRKMYVVYRRTIRET